MSRNVPRGLYRNKVGAELHVTGVAMPSEYGTLAGDISVAESRDPVFGTSRHLVTEASLAECGYELIDGGTDD